MTQFNLPGTGYRCDDVIDLTRAERRARIQEIKDLHRNDDKFIHRLGRMMIVEAITDLLRSRPFWYIAAPLLALCFIV